MGCINNQHRIAGETWVYRIWSNLHGLRGGYVQRGWYGNIVQRVYRTHKVQCGDRVGMQYRVHGLLYNRLQQQ